MRNNNVALYQGLFLFRNAMLPFIVKRLREAYGKGWWKAGVQQALGESGLAALERQFERRYGRKLVAVKRPGSEVYEMLDVGHFLPIIQRHWRRCFTDTFQQQDTTEVWLREIIEVRNAVAHPESHPLSNEDTWRAFDTMARFARLIDDGVADQIMQIRRELDVSEATATSPLWLELKEGPYDYGQGLAQLQTVILQEESQGSEIHLKLERHRDQLARLLWEKRLTPGVQDGQLENRVERVLEELDRLAIRYLSIPFADLCVTPAAAARPASPQNALIQIRELERQIEKLQNRLYQKQWKKLAQLQTGETVSKLERDLGRIQEELDTKRDELARLVETAAPPAFFSVRRRFAPNGRRFWVEEQFTEVIVDISNEGRETTIVIYR